jgi:hypothetical protein
MLSPPRPLMALALIVIRVMDAASANADCPCIDARPKLPLTDAGCLAPTCNSPLEPGNMNTSGLCITGGYGSSSCADWDQQTNYLCNVTNPPAYCSEPWCYVDAAAKRFERSRYFPGVSDLFFSYATCGGDRTDFANYGRLDKVSGRPLSFVVPSVTCTPPPFPSDNGSRQPGVKPNARAPASDPTPTPDLTRRCAVPLQDQPQRRAADDEHDTRRANPNPNPNPNPHPNPQPHPKTPPIPKPTPKPDPTHK